jgi:hypothetical protein
MKTTVQTLRVFDPAMCCSTGVCGPDVDTKLVQFAAFVENEAVQTALTDKGEAALPVILVNGKVTATGIYPGRGELAAWFKLKAAITPAAGESSCCCGGSC